MKPIFYLTAAQRRILESGTQGPVYEGRGLTPVVARLVLESLLMRRAEGRSVVSVYTSPIGKLALRAKPKKGRWEYPPPKLDYAHQVRRIEFCAVCGKIALNLPQYTTEKLHVCCLVRRDGWQALLLVGQKELAKMRASDFIFMGVTLPMLEEALVLKVQA